jgi:C-terminal processing protease CtpA/Prc
MIKMTESRHQDAAYLHKLEDEYEEQLAEAVRGTLPPEVIKSEVHGEAFESSKSIRKPIYILTDRECISSCESTTDFFEFNPLAKRIGENTGGYIHFGNVGYLVLKNSGIAVRMASTFNTYADGRFVEKIGIAPTIRVPSGQDALDSAWTDFFKNNKAEGGGI